MPKFRDIGGPEGLPEDDRITLIGTESANKIVGVMLERDDPDKHDRYIRKIEQRYPNVRFIDKFNGPTTVAVTLRFGPRNLNS